MIKIKLNKKQVSISFKLLASVFGMNNLNNSVIQLAKLFANKLMPSKIF